MKYVMKQKLFAWGDDFHIKDEDGRELCRTVIEAE